jgi:hypothetical protein
MATINGWLIDPFAQTITACTGDNESIADIMVLLRTPVARPGAFGMTQLTSYPTEFVVTDDLALLRDGQMFFTLDGAVQGGRGVVLSGTALGGAASTTLTEEQITALVSWQ